MGFSVQVGASGATASDVISVQATNDASRVLLSQLGKAGLLVEGPIVLSEPTGIISPARQELIDRESNEAVWEEIAALLRRDTNVGINFLMLMAVSGAIACIGIVEGTVHIVVGAMLLAPGFEPLVRIAFGALTHGRGTGIGSGVRSTLIGYLTLAATAGLCALLLSAMGRLPAGGLSSLSLVQYWTSIGFGGVLVAILAAIAGAAILASRRTVFAGGVMVALALVPGAAITGMGLALGDLDTAASALFRWTTEAACVLAAGGGVLALKRMILHRRPAHD